MTMSLAFKEKSWILSNQLADGMLLTQLIIKLQEQTYIPWFREFLLQGINKEERSILHW